MSEFKPGELIKISLPPMILESKRSIREASEWIRDERDEAEGALAEVLALLDRLDESGQDFDTDLIRGLVPDRLRAWLSRQVAEINACLATADQRAVLDAPAVAYDPEDPHKPEDGAQ